MSKLQTKELRMFKPFAANIIPNRILPIFSYLKFDGGTVTKSNMESFVSMKTTSEGSFLLDENVLMSFIDDIESDTIDVDIKGKSAMLSDGKEKMKCPAEDVINFPAIANGAGETLNFPSTILEQIKIASNFTLEVSNSPYTQCVFVGKGLVAATSGFIAYTKKVEGDLPDIVIEKNAVSSIKNFDHLEFSQADNYQFFKNGIFKFGFSKTETAFVNMLPFSQVPHEGGEVSIDKNEIIKFCDKCTSACQGRPLSVSIEDGKLTMTDSAYEIDYEKPLSAKLPDFVFNPVFMSKLLKSVPDTMVTFLKSGNKCYVTGDSGFVSLIMEMLKITN